MKEPVSPSAASFSPTSPPKANAQALMALGRAFNQVGDKRSLESFKEAGRKLLVAAREQHKIEAPKIGDKRWERSAAGPMPQPAAVKISDKGAR